MDHRAVPAACALALVARYVPITLHAVLLIAALSPYLMIGALSDGVSDALRICCELLQDPVMLASWVISGESCQVTGAA